MTFVVYGALGGALFLVPVELQLVAHYSALGSGLALLPITALMLVLSPRSGRLAARIGPRLQMSVGPVVVGVGLIMLTSATRSGSYITLVFPAMVVFGIGLTITVAPLTSTAMASAPAENAGVASAVNNAVARAAGLILVAVLPLLAGLTGAAALQPHHFASGFRVAMVIGGGMCTRAAFSPRPRSATLGMVAHPHAHPLPLPLPLPQSRASGGPALLLDGFRQAMHGVLYRKPNITRRSSRGAAGFIGRRARP